MSRPVEPCEMTAGELDEIPNFMSGLPLNEKLRDEALKAWRAGGLEKLNAWRVEKDQQQRTSRMRRAGETLRGRL